MGIVKELIDFILYELCNLRINHRNISKINKINLSFDK